MRHEHSPEFMAMVGRYESGIPKNETRKQAAARIRVRSASLREELRRMNATCLVMGDGPGVWDEIKIWRGLDIDHDVMTTGAIAIHYPWKIDHHATLNHGSVEAVRQYRVSVGWSSGFVGHVPTPKLVRQKKFEHLTWWPTPKVEGLAYTSGIFGLWVAAQLGYVRIIAAGMPMDQTLGSFGRPPWAYKADGDIGNYTWPEEVMDALAGKVQALSAGPLRDRFGGIE